MFSVNTTKNNYIMEFFAYSHRGLLKYDVRLVQKWRVCHHRKTRYRVDTREGQNPLSCSHYCVVL